MRTILFICLLVSMPLFAQDSLQEKKHNFFFEPIIGYHILRYTELTPAGKGSPYLAYNKQRQLALNANFLYRNEYLNCGFGATIFQVGRKNFDSGQPSFFTMYDAYLRVGFNFMSIFSSEESDFRIGPFATFGRIRSTPETFHLRNNCSLGIEIYKRNFRMAASVGVFKISDKEIAIQNLGSDYYKTNHLIAVNIGWCLPRRYPREMSL